MEIDDRAIAEDKLAHGASRTFVGSCYSHQMKILGCDPGLATFGTAVVEVGSDGQPRVMFMETFTSEKMTKKTRMTNADDRIIRLRQFMNWFKEIVGEHRPDLVAVETFSPPRNASAAAAVAMVWGSLLAMLEERRLSLVHATPQEWRKTLSPSDPDEKTVHALVTTKTSCPLPALKGHRPHALDAAGVGLWAVNTDIARALSAKW